MKTALGVCVVCLLSAQTRPAFEVASIKPSAQAGPYRVTESIDADGIRFDNVALRLCILRAFDLKPYQLLGPDWMDQARYVIAANTSAPAPRGKLLEMLQTLLADRFKLTFHREKREIPVYALVVAKNGPKLKEAKDDNTEINAGAGADVEFHGVPIAMLAGTIASSLDRPVLDETGLKGNYNFTLAWAERRRKGNTGEIASPDAPSIFTALQERLGLKLEPRRAPVEMFVIDHVERPSEN
jgi:uncharacterized protein (TIGR03435 family)